MCKDLSNVDIFDDINVYGNIYDSDIHHNHFGVYTYGHQQGDWRRNKMHDNTVYGFDPHDDSDLLTIHDNEVYDNVNHGIIASKRCNGVSIQVQRSKAGPGTPFQPALVRFVLQCRFHQSSALQRPLQR